MHVRVYIFAVPVKVFGVKKISEGVESVAQLKESRNTCIYIWNLQCEEPSVEAVSPPLDRQSTI